MGTYHAKSIDSSTFTLSNEGSVLGTLKYTKWYDFSAEIILANATQLSLEPTNFWDSKIELKKEGAVLLDFKMGWNGVLIKTYFDGSEKEYLMKLKGFLSSGYVLVDTAEKELLTIAMDSNWKKLRFDYIITTSEEFETFKYMDPFLLAILHCINYYLAVVSATI